MPGGNARVKGGWQRKLLQIHAARLRGLARNMRLRRLAECIAEQIREGNPPRDFADPEVGDD